MVRSSLGDGIGPEISQSVKEIYTAAKVSVFLQIAQGLRFSTLSATWYLAGRLSAKRLALYAPLDNAVTYVDYRFIRRYPSSGRKSMSPPS